jgi:hypothetical protein
MSAESEFYLNGRSGVVGLELLQVSHPAFTQTFYVVRNAARGVTVTLEDSTTKTFDYLPMQLTRSGTQANLDQSFKVSFGDLGQMLPQQLDAVRSGGTFQIKPVVLYRVYKSTDLTTPLIGPLRYVLNNIAFNKTGSSLDVSAPYLSVNRTGESYDMNRFPMLKALI